VSGTYVRRTKKGKIAIVKKGNPWTPKTFEHMAKSAGIVGGLVVVPTVLMSVGSKRLMDAAQNLDQVGGNRLVRAAFSQQIDRSPTYIRRTKNGKIAIVRNVSKPKTGRSPEHQASLDSLRTTGKIAGGLIVGSVVITGGLGLALMGKAKHLEKMVDFH